MKILITGGAGYIGSVLTRKLLSAGNSVTVIDKLIFGGNSLIDCFENSNFCFIKDDIINIENHVNLLKNIEAIVHLAAIVGDPACKLQPDIAEKTNLISSKKIFDISNKLTNIKRFIFASTCSNYGKMNGYDIVNEESLLSPVSLYAKLKVEFEDYLLNSETRNDFYPTSLRFATVYGFSPRMRFDLTVNEFTRDLFFNKPLEVFGENFWRPYCHVKDIANAIKLTLEKDPNIIQHNIFNVGNSNENYTKKMLIDIISKFIPNVNVKFIHKEEDPRDYKVDFSKINRLLGFTTTRTVKDGIKEIIRVLESGIISNPYDKIYRNI
jgi:nucleoside-diphosphate-sugar epimerase